MTATLLRPETDFVLPDELVAEAPAEERGVPRDGVRMLVSSWEGLAHRRFFHLADVLEPGDLLVVNTSGTLAAAVDGTRGDGRPAPLHVAGELDDGSWVVEVRRPDQHGPATDVAPGELLQLPAGAVVAVVDSYPRPGVDGSRLWRARATGATRLGSQAMQLERVAYLARHGRPIAYGPARWPLAAYQTMFGTDPGSAEMPSAARPFTPGTLVDLIARGVVIAPITLHCGVSSPEAHELPSPERFSVPATTARVVNETRRAGGRVVAVGTTAVRALETVAEACGEVRAGAGWTEHVVGPETPVRVVDGLLTGLHEPRASHLLMLEAVAGPERVRAAYDASLAAGYLWHQFGDLNLFLP